MAGTMSTTATSTPDAAFAAARTALVASVALGAVVRHLGLRLGRWRWLHHALFAVSLAATATSLTADVTTAGRHLPRAGVSGAVLGVLLALPRTSGGSRRHTQIGLAALVTHVVGARVVADGSRRSDGRRA